MRARFTISPEAWARAREYAKATNRTPSELVVEALEQIQARYPSKRHHATETDIDVLAGKVAAIIASKVPAGTP